MPEEKKGIPLKIMTSHDRVINVDWKHFYRDQRMTGMILKSTELEHISSMKMKLKY